MRISTIVKKFTIDNKAEIKDHYESQGFVVVEGLINHEKIDNFIDQYEKIKSNKNFIFYSQSLHLPSRPKITPEGFIEESMENPTDLKLFPGFSGTVLECLIDKNISTVLHTLSGESNHTMWQSMFFDKSTGTIEHQDHYYLDTVPSGNLIAAWYALEDIHQESGCFFVLSGSHKGEVLDRENIESTKGGVEGYYADHDQMRQKISNLIQESDYECQIFPLNKGDVIFWHPYAIHGAYENQNPQFSRKSFTAHFYPSSFERSDGTKPSFKKSSNPNIYIKGNYPKLLGKNIKLYTTYLLNKFKNQKSPLDMRRESYQEDS